MKSEQEIELELCPFCGGTAYTTKTCADFAVSLAAVLCSSCGARTNWYSDIDPATAERHAVEAWNRRAP